MNAAFEARGRSPRPRISIVRVLADDGEEAVLDLRPRGVRDDAAALARALRASAVALIERSCATGEVRWRSLREAARSMRDAARALEGGAR